ncbi:MAG: hypothetical protein OEM01_01885 [Desulfobulbaceae bacterium]|nr:hypothetical protein [Desulfobulbaceae bacterium]
MKHFSTRGILFLVGALRILLVFFSRGEPCGEGGCFICANIPLWPG